MRRFASFVALSSVVALAACGPDAPVPPADDLAWLDSVTFTQKPAVASAIELGLDSADAKAVESKPQAEAPRRSTRRPAATTPRTSAPDPMPAPAPAPRTVTERHTVRDAAIGAGAGAVIGAVAGGRGDRVKGAIIGGSAGAVIGAVIGHTVDKKERIVYDH